MAEHWRLIECRRYLIPRELPDRVRPLGEGIGARVDEKPVTKPELVHAPFAIRRFRISRVRRALDVTTFCERDGPKHSATVYYWRFGKSAKLFWEFHAGLIAEGCTQVDE